MKFTLGIFLSLFFIGNLSAAQIVNVDFIHRYINQKHDINVSIANPSQTGWAANMKYMLCTIDVANNILNGWKASNYCNSSFATQRAVDTVAAINGVDILIGMKCRRPCSDDIYDYGKAFRCVDGCFTNWENCPRNEDGPGTCGCSPSTFPNGNGFCEMVTPCSVEGEVAYGDGKECTCTDGDWVCNVNCPVCDTSCGCPIGKIPDGNGNCVTGMEPCIQGDVGYYLQTDGVTVLAKNCPMSGFHDFCPLIRNNISCTGYNDRPGWGNSYLENCCVDSSHSQASSKNKAQAINDIGMEYPFMNVFSRSILGVRMAYVKEENGQLIVSRGTCRRPYINDYCNPATQCGMSILGTVCEPPAFTCVPIDSCKQGANDNNGNPASDCQTGLQFNSYRNNYLSDFPL